MIRVKEANTKKLMYYLREFIALFMQNLHQQCRADRRLGRFIHHRCPETSHNVHFGHTEYIIDLVPKPTRRRVQQEPWLIFGSVRQLTQRKVSCDHIIPFWKRKSRLDPLFVFCCRGPLTQGIVVKINNLVRGSIPLLCLGCFAFEFFRSQHE